MNIKLNNAKKNHPFQMPQAVAVEKKIIDEKVAQIQKLNLPISQEDTRKMVSFIENKKHILFKKNYLPEYMTSLPHGIEIDAETKNIYIHNLGNLGKGAFKVASKSIWYNDKEGPKIVAHLEARDGIAAQREVEMAKKTQGMDGIVRLLSSSLYSRDVTPFTTLKVCSFVTDYYNAGSLDDMNRQKKFTLKPLEKIKVAKELIGGLKKLHDQNIIHADLKSPNVLINVNEDGHKPRKVSGVIGDLGCSYFREKVLQIPCSNATPGFEAPEAFGKKILKKSSAKGFDIYALGCTLYELQFGKGAEWIGFSSQEESKASEEAKNKLLDLQKKQQEKICVGKAPKSIDKLKTLKDKESKKILVSKLEAAQKKLISKKSKSAEQSFINLIMKISSPDPKKRGKIHEINKKIKAIYEKALKASKNS